MFTVAIVGIGLSISAVSANMQQAMLYTFVLLMPLVLIGRPGDAGAQYAAGLPDRHLRQSAALRGGIGAQRISRVPAWRGSGTT